MYQEIIDAMKDAENDPNVLVCCFTGSGSYYSSGNDLTNYMNLEDPETAIENGSKRLELVYFLYSINLKFRQYCHHINNRI